MIIKGIPGYLPDVMTYEFEPTGTHGNITGAWGSNVDIAQYRCTGVGTYLNLYTFFNNEHPELLTQGGSFPEPIEILSGIYLSYMNELSTYYDMRLTIDVDVWEAVDGTTGRLSGEYKFELYKPSAPFVGWVIGFAHVSGLYCYKYVEGIQVWDYYSAGGDGILFLQSPSCRSADIASTELNTYPVLIDSDNQQTVINPNQIVVSSDDSHSWYYLSSPNPARPYGPQFQLKENIALWRKMQFETNQEGDTSGPGGGGGNYGYEDSDTNHYDGIPTVTPASSGFINVYHASVTNLLDMAKFMYTDAFLQNVPKLVSNPIDYIISLMLCAAAPDDGTAESLRIGSVKNVAIQIAPVMSVYKTFDCGTVNVEECFGGFLDYAPFTKVRMQLPFCGDIDLDPQIVMHSSVHLRYVVDFLTGSCLARVDVTNNHGIAAETYFKDGNCAVSVPMTGADFNSYYSSIFNAGFSAVSAGVTALATGNPLALMGAVGGGNTQRPHAETTVTGHLGSNHGFLGNYTPALIISRPVQSFPEGYNPNKGRPSNIGGTLGSFSGYTSVTSIKLDGVVATDAELSEIRQLLAGGVYV